MNCEPITAEWVLNAARGCHHFPTDEVENHLDGSQTIVGGFASDGRWSRNFENPMGWCDTQSFAVAKTHDGQYLWIQESSDTTGHGCVCSGSWGICEALEDALLSLDFDCRIRAKEWLGGAA